MFWVEKDQHLPEIFVTAIKWATNHPHGTASAIPAPIIRDEGSLQQFGWRSLSTRYRPQRGQWPSGAKSWEPLHADARPLQQTVIAPALPTEARSLRLTITYT